MLQPGSQLRDYTIDRHLGSGSFGSVYKATQARDPAPVALKICPTTNPEADVLSQLDHTAIPSLIDRFSIESGHVTVLQYVDGVSLAAVLAAIFRQSRRRLRVCDAFVRIGTAAGFDDPSAANDLFRSKEPFVTFSVRICQNVAAVLLYAHENGIFHKDVKPENILIDSAGKAWLIDWGVAVGNASSPNERGGTLNYMHPNALQHLAGLNPPTVDQPAPSGIQDDRYALGIVLYEMLTGELPLLTPAAGSSVIVQARELMAAQYNLPTTISASTTIPRPLRTVISMCVATGEAPQVAYANMQQVADDLQSFLTYRPPAYATETWGVCIARLRSKHKFAVNVLASLLVSVSVVFVIDRYFEITRLDAIDAQRKILMAADSDIKFEPAMYSAIFETGMFPDSRSLRIRRTEVAHGLAAALLSKGEADIASQLLQRVVALDPHNGDAQNNLGTALDRMGRYDDALKAFDKALQLDCDHSAVLSNRGAAFASLGQHEAARRDIERAIRLNPENQNATLNLELLDRLFLQTHLDQ